MRGLNVKGGGRKIQPQDDRRADAVRRPVRSEGAGLLPRERRGGDSIRRSPSSSRTTQQREIIQRFNGRAGRPAVPRGRRQQVGDVGRSGRAPQPPGQGAEALRSEGAEGGLDPGLPARHLQRGRKALGRGTSSVLLPGRRGRSLSRFGPRPRAGPVVRPGRQRLRSGQRQRPYPRRGHAAKGLQPAGHRARKRPSGASAFCWKPCATARRRTRGSRWASTAG